MITTTVFVSFCLVAATLNWSVFSCFWMMKFRGKMKRDHSIHISFHLYIIIYFLFCGILLLMVNSVYLQIDKDVEIHA